MKSNNKGFSLVEIILAIAILGIMAVSFIPVFTAGYKSIIYAGGVKTEMFSSQGIVEEKMADVTNEGLSNLRIIFSQMDARPAVVVDRPGDIVADESFILFRSKQN